MTPGLLRIENLKAYAYHGAEISIVAVRNGRRSSTKTLTSIQLINNQPKARCLACLGIHPGRRSISVDSSLFSLSV